MICSSSESSVNASMDHQGAITLSGHVDNGMDKQLLERLAMRVRGASRIKNLVNTD